MPRDRSFELILNCLSTMTPGGCPDFLGFKFLPWLFWNNVKRQSTNNKLIKLSQDGMLASMGEGLASVSRPLHDYIAWHTSSGRIELMHCMQVFNTRTD